MYSVIFHKLSGRLETVSPRVKICVALGVVGLVMLLWPPASPAVTTHEVTSPAGARLVRVGLYENRPKIFTAEKGRAAGIFVGILDEIARRQGWQVVYEPCTWSECLAELEAGRLDLMPDVAFSQKRAARFDFHQEKVLESWSQVYSHGKKPLMSLADLAGRRIALLDDSIQQAALEEMMNGLGYEITIVGANSYEQAFTLAASGTVDAVVANHLFGNYYYQEYGLQRTAIVFNPVSLYFATTRGANADLLAAVDLHLRAMKAESGSTYYRELAGWLTPPPTEVVPPYLVWLMAGIGGLLGLALVLIWLLRRQVGRRTRHLLEANETLRESEEKFRSLFQDHAAVKLIIDPAGGAIVEANRAAASFYGWSPEELQGQRLQEIDTQPTVELKELMAGQRTCCECRHRLADGSARDVEVFGSTIDIRGKTLLHCIIHDITEQRKLEEQLRQAQKMEAVGRLAGGVAHDYNNILSVIIGYTELALQEQGVPEPLPAYLQEIYAAAGRSRDITRQLLAFARKEAIEPQILDVNSTVEGLLTILQRLVGEDIELIWRPTPGVAPVLADPAQIDQILANLCVNARDAITDVGKVIIETGSATFDEAYCGEHVGFVAGDFVMLAISDTGSGMDRQTQNMVFEPFFTTKGIGHGTGLGLATVFGIVKQNNGFINVYSEPGHGTTFRLYLPAQVGVVPEKSREIRTPVQSGNGERLLVVEDETAILGLVERILRRLNYLVVPATSPSEAFAAADQYGDDIALVITDVVMPEMNGRQLAEELQKSWPKMKCLYMSGYTTDVIAHRGVIDKGLYFIQKPFTVSDLAGKVRVILDG